MSRQYQHRERVIVYGDHHDQCWARYCKNTAFSSHYGLETQKSRQRTHFFVIVALCRHVAKQHASSADGNAHIRSWNYSHYFDFGGWKDDKNTNPTLAMMHHHVPTVAQKGRIKQAVLEKQIFLT